MGTDGDAGAVVAEPASTPGDRPPVTGIRRFAGVGWAMAAGFGVRLMLVLADPGSSPDRFTFVDSDSYLRVGRAMPSILWSPSEELLSSSLGRTPAYPMLTWLSGGTRVLVLLVLAQCVLGGLVNVWLTHRLARSVAGAGAASVAAWAVALDPVSIGVNLLVATETLASTAVLLAVLAAHRAIGNALDAPAGAGAARWAVLSGAAAAVAGLTRPNLVVLLPFLACVVAAAAFGRRRTGAALAVGVVVLVAGALPIGAWLARNQAVAGQPVLATVAGQNLADFGLAAVAREDGRLGAGPITRDDYDAVLAPLAIEVGLSPPVDGDLTSVATSERWSEEGLALLRDHPRGAIAVATSGVVRAQVAPGASLAVDHLPHPWDGRVRPVAQVAAAGWLLVLQLGACAGGVVLGRARRWADLSLLAGTVVLIAASAAGPWMDARFRVPAVPLVAVLAGLGLRELWMSCARRCASSA